MPDELMDFLQDLAGAALWVMASLIFGVIAFGILIEALS